MTLVAPKTILISTAPVKMSAEALSVVDGAGVPINRLEEIMESAGPRKRKRLTHLSPEERMLRRKLKNRVAAQTARDRKKSQMSDLETLVAELEQENQRLQQENSTLRQVTGSLTKENVGLKERLGVQASSTGAECVSESAVLPSTPLPKEKAHTLLLWLAHCLALLITSRANCSGSSSKCPKSLRKMNPRLRSQLLKCVRQTQRKWWGPQQRSWSPSMN